MRGLYAVALLAGCGRFAFDGSPSADAGPDAPFDVCDPRPTTETVALYTFEGMLGADATSTHDARVVGGVEPTSATCGSGAAHFTGGHLVISDSPAFDLAEGAVDLHLNVHTPATGVLQGVLSRDANGTDFDGHFSIAVAETGRLWVRLQRNGGSLSVFRCSEPLVADRWAHVAVSFGSPGFRLWVDGVEATTTPMITTNGSVVRCDVPHPFGIDGNDNVLVVGGLIFTAINADPAPVPTHPLDGAIDQLRISSVWRDFTAP